MIEGFFTLLGALLLVILVIFLSYYVTKYLAKGAVRINGTSHMKVLDRIVLGQDRALLIVQIGAAYYLIGSSDQSISLLKELNPDDLISLPDNESQDLPGFKQSFRTILKDRVSRKS